MITLFSLSWANIKEMYAELLIPKEFEELYLKIAGADQQLQLHEFRDFLRDYQKETHYSDEQIKQMILDYEKTDLESTTDIGTRLSCLGQILNDKKFMKKIDHFDRNRSFC